MFDMNSVLGAKFGTSGKVEVVCKKTYKVKGKDFETEAVEARASVEVEESSDGMDRLMSIALLQAQVEYAVYSNLAYKSAITENEFFTRKTQLLEDVNQVAKKYETLKGINPMDVYIGAETQTHILEAEINGENVEKFSTVESTTTQMPVNMQAQAMNPMSVLSEAQNTLEQTAQQAQALEAQKVAEATVAAQSDTIIPDDIPVPGMMIPTKVENGYCYLPNNTSCTIQQYNTYKESITKQYKAYLEGQNK